MKYKSQSRYGAALLSFWCLINWASAASITEETPTEEPAGVESTTTNPQIDYLYPSPCYVEKSKVAELMIRMNHTVQILNPKDDYLKCGAWDKPQVVEVESEIEACTDERILRIQKDLVKLTGSLFKLATRLKDPSWEEVNDLDLKKFRLMDDLKVLRVYTGNFPCDSSTIVLYPFGSLTEYVEWNLEQVIALFNQPRLTRPPTTATTPASTTTSSTPKPGDEMLNPEKSFSELIQLARLDPSAMSNAVPQIVFHRYSQRTSIFNKLVTFVRSLPTPENQILGLAAIYDEMHRYNRNRDLPKLSKLEEALEAFNASVLPTLDATARSKLTDLIQDIPLTKFDIIVNLDYAELAELGRSNPTTLSKALPQIISHRSNTTISQFNDILDFVEGLPTVEDKILGVSLIYDEMHRPARTLDLNELLKLAKIVKQISNATEIRMNFTRTASKAKLDDLTHKLSPLILTGKKSRCQIANIAYDSHLTADGKAWPESAYLISGPTDIIVYPKLNSGKPVFSFHKYGSFQFYASDTNTEGGHAYGQKKSSERHVLLHPNGQVPANAETDWKLVPVLDPKTPNQFRILTAKSDDFMFAHKSARGYESWRRVILGKKGYSNHDHVAKADLWTFKCKPEP